LVEKRTIVFVTLAMLVWASIATGSMAYYYLEQIRYQEQFNENQQLLVELSENYNTSIVKQDLLSRDYNALLGEYYQFLGENCSLFMDKYTKLLSNLSSNYTSTLNKFPKMNETHNNLLNKTQTLCEQSVVTRGEFDSLLNDFYRLFAALTAKELERFIGEMSAIKVNLCIDYGNETKEWHNVSTSSGMTLFDLTQNITNVKYDYYPLMEPGHILVTSINNLAPSGGKYWFWNYWDEGKNEWIRGQVGCDAWTLKNNGTYKWVYEMWQP
jgi:hypothetical protein